MRNTFSIDLDWTNVDLSSSSEERLTSSFIKITLGEHVLTQALDEWSKSVRDSVLLSAYPLAMWIASSWWRLRWEPVPNEPSRARRLDWRMAHELAAAGSGFVWPRVTFESDRENVFIRSLATDQVDSEPIQYLGSNTGTISGTEFERSIDAFMSLVLSRLEAVGLPQTELFTLWKEVVGERTDPDRCHFRQIEAELGFDPDEAPVDSVHNYIEASGRVGKAAISEVAVASSAIGNPAETLAQLIELERSVGINGRTELSIDNEDISNAVDHADSPGSCGWQLAHLARDQMGISNDFLADEQLSSLLGITCAELSGQMNSEMPPISLAVRSDDSKETKFFFRKGNRPGRRFEAARFIADSLIAPQADRWLTATDSKTARQKIQRAFAAEFLCPIEALKTFLSGDYSNDALEGAGERFGFSPLAVKSHLANHGVIEFDYRIE